MSTESTSNSPKVPENVSSKSSEHRRVVLGSPAQAEPETEPLLESERTRYVSVDDPIVSPLRLKGIRILRGILLLILMINNFLFLIFLLSDFVAIPGFAGATKSFFEIDLIVITTINNILTLWYFAIPSFYERCIGYVTAGLLLIDIIVIGMLNPARKSYGLIGFGVLTWSFLNILLCGLADYWVEQGKVLQEIKYISRPETRKSVFELVITLCKLILKSVIFILVLLLSLNIWIECFDNHEKPWGAMVPIGNDKFEVHLACFGNVSSTYAADGVSPSQPIILVEGGQDVSSETFSSWIEELFLLNKVERYCVWDRPGYGFSKNAPSPLSIGIVTEYLMEALEKENIKGPFSIVGFDIGGLYARSFASRNQDNVHSLMLVDSWSEKLLLNNPFKNEPKPEEKDTFREIFEFMDVRAGLSIWWRGILSPVRFESIYRLILHPFKYSSSSRIYGDEMKYSSKYLKARLQEQITSSIISYNEVVSANIFDVPLTVVSSDLMIKKSPTWGKWQHQLTKLSSKTQEWVITKSTGHFIWKYSSGKNVLQDSLLNIIE